MTQSRSEAVLASPLGRQLLTGYLEVPGGFDCYLYGELGLGPMPGTAALIAGGPAAGSRSSARRAPVTRLGALLSRRRTLPPEPWLQVTAGQARAVVGAAVGQLRWRYALAGATELELLGAIAGDSDGFGFTGRDDAVWHITELAADELRPVADAFVDAAGAAGWWEPVDLTTQRFTEWDDLPRLTGEALEQSVREQMAVDRAENAQLLRSRKPRVERPDVSYGAYWWSSPGFADQSWTTTAVGELPAASLIRFFDTYGPGPDCDGANVWRVQINPAARVLEINDPAHWQDLVARFPRDVTGTHDGEWRDWGGVPGPWRLPDWEQVMEHYDGVHVSAGGYVTSCGAATPADGGYTMLSAWIPGATLWLRDMVTGAGLLGRWEGGPRGGDALDDEPPHWRPGP